MVFLGFLVLAFILAPYGIGVWAHLRAGRLERQAVLRDAEISKLRENIDALRRGQARPEEQAAPQVDAESHEDLADAAFSYDEADQSQTAPVPSEIPASASSGRKWFAALNREGLEHQFGAVLPVWIGGIALAFAGFFLVKYSIDNQLIGPELRVLLGGLLGVALLAASRWVGAQADTEPSTRIKQALTGAGIAVLYVSAYAATALYGLLPPFIGFVGIAAITALAVVLALRHGPPIALLGMIGGFLTPALMASGKPSALLFFTYLFFVFAALMTIIAKRGWWLMALPALIAAFAWVLVWILSGSAGGSENIWIALFLIAVAGTIVATSRERYGEELASITSWRHLFSWHRRALALNIISIAGAMGLMALLAFQSSFGFQDWMLFAILALGAIALAYFSPALYGFAAWAAMVINAIMLAGWSPGTSFELMITVAAFGALYTASGFLLIAGSLTPLLWAGLSASAALGYYLIGFFRLTPPPPVLPEPIAINKPQPLEPIEPLFEGVKEVAASIPHEWAVVAMGLALTFLAAALWSARRFPASLIKDRIIAIYALATTAFIALAFFVELDREFLSVAIAAELLAVTWVASRTQIASLHPIAALLGITFAFLLIPQILLLAQLSLYSVFDIKWRVQESVPIVDFPIFQLALPAICFFLAAYTLRRMADGKLVRMLEIAGVALIALWGFYTTAKLFHPGENVLFAKAGFLERGVITNVLFLYGLLCLVIARYFSRPSFFQCGMLLAAVALFRILYFDLIMKNPALYGGEVAGVLPFDALSLTFLAPIVWSWLAANEIRQQAVAPWLLRLGKMIGLLMLIMAFAWLTLAIRKLYQGPVLDGPLSSDAEFYSYSAAWLVFALGLLFYGTLRGGQLLRYASLVILLMTVTKVFLFDAGNLTGLYRVFSFLGLGLTLLGISYFYGRFVFGKSPGQEGEAAAEPTP